MSLLPDLRKPFSEYYLIDYVLLVIVIGLAILIGLGAANEFTQFKYYNQVMSDPCQTCQMNFPNQSSCIHNCFRYEITTQEGIPLNLNLSNIKFMKGGE